MKLVAFIKKQMISMLRILKRVFIVLIFMIFLVVLSWIAYASSRMMFDYVELPNGLCLVSKSILPERIAVTDLKGNIIVEPEVHEVIWNDQYLAGWQSRRADSNTKKYENIKFIYKIGDAEPVYSYSKNYTETPEYIQKFKESGLDYTVEIAPRKFMDISKTYWSLIKDPAYRRTWHRLPQASPQIR